MPVLFPVRSSVRWPTTTTIRCCNPGKRRTACRRSTGSRPSTTFRRSCTRCTRTAPRSNAIAESADPPTFDNTIAALDRSGRDAPSHRAPVLQPDGVGDVADLQAIERDISPQLAAHHSAICLDAKLFARIEAVHDRRDELPADAEERRLTERIHLDFVREGARLSRGRQGALRGDRRAPRGCSRRDSAERAGRRSGLPAAARRRARSRRPARRRPRGGARGRAGARRRRAWDHHAVALADRAVPHVLGPARPARAGVQGVDDAAASTTARTTTVRSPARSSRCATSRRGCTATDTTPTTRSSTGWPARRTPSRGCWRRCGSRRRPAPPRSAMRWRRWRMAQGETHAIEPWDWRYYAEKVRKARYELGRRRS